MANSYDFGKSMMFGKFYIRDIICGDRKMVEVYQRSDRKHIPDIMRSFRDIGCKTKIFDVWKTAIAYCEGK